MSKRITLLLIAAIAALPLFAAQDVLTIGSISALPGSTVTVPIYLRDLSGTALGTGSGTGNRIQGIMLQAAVTPTAAGSSINFEHTGILRGPTPLYQRAGSGRWIGSYSESAQPLPFTGGAAAPGDRIGTFRITLPASLTGTPSVTVAFNPLTTILSNEAGTVTESVANRHLQLVSGTITLSGSSTSIALTSTPNPSQSGNNVAFSTTITSPAPGAIGGSVIFIESSQIIGSAMVQNGQATWNTSALSVGTHSITASYEGDSTHLPSFSNAVPQTVTIAVAPPTGLVATASSPTNVNLSWNASANATQYEVRRKPAGGSYALVGTLSGTAFSDATAAADQTYFYVVRGLASGVSSADSAPDHATTVMFSDQPLVAGTTKVKLAHLTELRTAVNAFRAAAGLAPASFSGSPSYVLKSDLETLRSGLQQARQALGMSTLTFTDAIPSTIKAVHFQELRTALQ